MITTTIEDNKLTIVIPIEANPQPSSTGKSLLIATTHGTVTTSTLFNGKPVKISLNAMIAAR